MYNDTIEKIKPEMEKALNYLKEEIKKIRTGRANPSLVEDVTVECFGQKFPLKQLAAISTPDPKQIVVQPWDKSYLEPIEKSLAQESLGASPVVDQDKIRIKLPSMSEEYRQKLSNILSEKQEETRKTIRRWREEAWNEIQEKEKNGEIREDAKFKAKEELQELVDEYNNKIKELIENKKKVLKES